MTVHKRLTFIAVTKQVIFHIHFLLGEWISPLVIGQGQPRYLFTLSSLNCNTVIMFGGNTPHGISNTIYIGSCTDSLIVSKSIRVSIHDVYSYCILY